MAALVVEGGRRLSGVVEVEGNKNAALPILAACLLTSEECVLENAPRIRDVEAMCRLLQGLGAEVAGIGTSTLRVRCRERRPGKSPPGSPTEARPHARRPHPRVRPAPGAARRARGTGLGRRAGR